MAAKKRLKDGTRRIASGSSPGRRAERSKNSGYVREKRDVRQSPDKRRRSARQYSDARKRDSRRSPDVREQKKRGNTRKRQSSRWKLVLGILLGAAGLALLGYLGIQLFETKEITVTGNKYCSEQEIIDWLLADKYSGNSLYILWKYNQNDVKQLPAVEETKVGLKSLGEIQVQVKEKDFSGRIDYNEAFLYFDQDGIASLISGDVIEGVPYIEGMELKPEEVILGEELPVTDSQIFEELKELMPLLEKQELSPDKISCAGTDLTLHFGGIRVQIGNDQFADRLAQVPPILEKLTELYAGQAGVLHLENYDISGSSIRFVPDTASQAQPEAE